MPIIPASSTTSTCPRCNGEVSVSRGVVELGEQPREGGRLDPGGVTQLERGPGGKRDTGDADPRGFPGLPCRVEGVGLAGAGLADHDGDPVTVGREPADHGGLVVPEGRPAVQGGRERGFGHDGNGTLTGR